MRQMNIGVCALAAALWIGGCGEHDHDHDSPSAGTAQQDDHGHAHSHEPEMKETLGREQAGPYEVLAVQNSKLRPGGEMNFDVEILGQPRPRSVEFWIGTEAATASEKVDAISEKDGVYHVDVEAPNPLPENYRLWIEIAPPEGAPRQVSFDIKP